MINNNNNNNIVNMITRQMTPLSTSILWTLSVGIFYFCISRPFACSGLVEYIFTCQRWHFQAC